MAKSVKAPVKVVHISAKTGQYVTPQFAQTHKATTVALTVPAK